MLIRVKQAFFIMLAVSWFNAGWGQCGANINAVNTTTGCIVTETPVVWTDLVNVTVSGNDISRPSGNGWNSSGAASTDTLTDQMYMYTVVNETNTYRMVGLSNGNPNAHYNSIDFAFYLVTGGALRIYESGINRGNFGSYAAGDTLKIYVESGQVNYYQNGSLIYSSNISPVFPLVVDASIYSNTGTIEKVTIGGYTEGDFICHATNVGASPTYQWELNGVAVGTNSATYSNVNLSDGDLVTCEVTPSAGFCSNVIQVSNAITITDAISDNFEVLVSPVQTVSGCLAAETPVIWSDPVNVNQTGNSIVRPSGNGWGSSGAASKNELGDDMYMYTIANETNRRRMIGLSNGNANAHYNTIDFAIFLRDNGTIRIYESGAYRGQYGAYATGDTLKVFVESGQVNYYRNSTLLYTSNTAPTFPLVVDASIYSNGGTLENVTIGNFTQGQFTVSATQVGSSPIYQWKLNGANVGTNSASYANTTLADGDVLYCEVTPDLGNCSGTSISSQAINIRGIESQNFAVEVSPTATVNGCLVSETPIRWVDPVNATINGNNLSRPSGNGWGSSGSASSNQLTDNMYVYTIANETNRRRMIGLSNGNTNAHYNTIDFAFFLRDNGTIRVYESGTYRGQFGSYVNGDTLKIFVESGQVNYYRNSTLLYASNTAPVFPLVVDASIYTNGGTLENVTIGNFTQGQFTASASNAGTSPVYQWKLNGVNVGTNSTTYTNTTLADGDTLLCEVTPDLGNCASATLSSNSVSIRAIESESFDVTVSAVPVVTGCLVAETPVKWTDLVNVSASGNSISRPSGNGWNAGAASMNEVNDNMYIYTVVNETNRRRMIGLSNGNTDANYNTIDFAIYLRDNATIRIYESGAYRGQFGTYATGDTMKIYVESGQVNYYKNEILIYSSTVAPTFPLVVDASIYSSGGTFGNVTIGSFTDGQFTASVFNGGPNPIYQWKLNGTNVGTNSTNYTNASLSDGDVLYCEVTPDLGNCGGTALSSNAVDLSALQSLNLTAMVEPSYTISGCVVAEAPVIWTDLVSVTASGSTISRPSGNGWNAGAASVNTVTDNMYMYSVVTETNRYKMVGLSQTNTNAHYNTIDYAFYMVPGGSLLIFESGINRGSFGTYAVGDTLKAYVESGQVNYYNNGVLIYSSTVVPSLPLIVDASIYSATGTIGNATVGGFTHGAFTCNGSNLGANPTYQWKLNGVNVGSNSANYTNTTLTNSDEVSCEVTPDILLCGNTEVQANKVTIRDEISTSFELEINPTYIASSCIRSESPVMWTDLVNVSVAGNNITRTSGNGWNSSGAASVNKVNDNMYMYTVVNETNRYRMIGLSNENPNSHYNTIDYAFYLVSGGGLRIYESGAYRGAFGTYSAGDTLMVYVEAGQVNYYRNSTLLYSSSINPTLPLVVDASIYSNSGTFESVTVGGFSDQNFTSSTVNVGSNPTYIWRLNGQNVGSNSATYSNSNLQTNDMVECWVLPDFSTCSNDTLYSNIIVMVESGGIVQTVWTGASNTDWANGANWSNGVPSESKNVFIPTGLSNYPVITAVAHCRNLFIETAASLEITTNDTLHLSGGWTNDGGFTTTSGAVSFRPDCDGSADIYNNEPLSLYNMVLFDGVDLSISGAALSIRGALSLEDGTLHTNDSLIIISDAIETGRITELKNGSTVNGDVEMQRYIDAGATNWRFLTFAVSGQNLEAFDDDFTTSGFPGTDFPTWPSASNPWSSFYYYTESLGTNYVDGFHVPTSTADLVGVGQGLWIWCGDTLQGTNPFTIDATGPINHGDISLPVTYTPSSGIANEDGWNLVANPYPCTIDWDAVDWTKSNLDGSIFVWNPDNAQYATYIGGVGVNLGSNKIASSQAFWVHANGPSPQLDIKESCKLNEDHGFIKKAAAQPQLLRLKLTTKGAPIWDETVLRFEANATDTFDTDFDALKFYSADPNSAQISSVLNGTEYAINSFDQASMSGVIRLKVVLATADSCTIRATDISGIKGMTCVLLEDLLTGDVTDLVTDSIYHFYQAAQNTTARFKITFKSKPNIGIEPVTCVGTQTGAISFDSLVSPIDYALLNALGDTLQSAVGVVSGEINNLGSGTYALTYTHNLSQCGLGMEHITIFDPLPIMSSSVVQGVDCENCCNGSADLTTFGGTGPYVYTWSDSTIQVQGNHAEGLCAGDYQVTITDANGCDTTLMIHVPSTVGIEAEPTAATIGVNMFPNPAHDFAYIEAEIEMDKADLMVFNSTSKQVTDQVKVKQINDSKLALDISHLAKGTYFVIIDNRVLKLVKQ